MQIVIDIPEETYKRTKFYHEFRDLNDCVITLKAIDNAVPLPKGHGRLIDVDALIKKQTTRWTGEAMPFELVDEEDLRRADIIVGADTHVNNYIQRSELYNIRKEIDTKIMLSGVQYSEYEKGYRSGLATADRIIGRHLNEDANRYL